MPALRDEPASEGLLDGRQRGSVNDSVKLGDGGGGGSSVFASVMNLSNTILGAGALAMPFACAQCGLLLFAVLLSSIAAAAHLSIRLLAISVDKHNMTATARYSSLGERAYGKLGASVAMMAVGLQQLGPCIIYIQITADILVPILCEANPFFLYEETSDDCNADRQLRNTLQLVVVVVCLLPLSMVSCCMTAGWWDTVRRLD